MTTPTSAAKKRQSDKRWESFNFFYDEVVPTIPAAETVIWTALFRRARPPSWAVEASFGHIAGWTGLSRRTVARAVASLKARGLLKVIRNGGPNAGSAVYRPHPIPTAAPASSHA